MRNTQLKEWGKKYFENNGPAMPISLILYKEDYCELYELPNNKVIKLTSTDEGYTTAIQLCGKQNKNIVDIYQYGYFEYKNKDDDEETIYYIIMEKLNVNYLPLSIIKEFVDAFRHCWFIQYKNEYKSSYRYLTYDDLKPILSNPNNPEIEIVKNYLTSYINSKNKEIKEIILSLYKETCNAYHELYLISPNAKIDFNEGNIGFTKNGVLKYFDLQ